MNRTEVIATIQKAGGDFGQVMAALCGEEFAAGYRRALNDMIRLFQSAPIDADFDAERAALMAHIEALTVEKERLQRDVNEKHATIQKLLSHVNISEVLGVTETQKPPTRRRVTVFSFR